MTTLQPISKWHELATFSHYQTATAIRHELLQGDIEEAIEGIEELVAALSRSDQRELKSQLIRLMAHIIKWKSQPERRSRSWITTIVNARVEIETLLEFEPHLNPLVPGLLQGLWVKAKRVAEKEMGKPSIIDTLSWQEVFEDDYP
ncbi:MAG: DUF29 domain-containing protein [Chloroflexota bacterium]|nr:DUF29 domain-containing protein [Chloroflexota bacterium]